MSVTDLETIALDAVLSTENELRARLESAIADNQRLATNLDSARRLARRWRRLYDSAIREARSSD